MGPKLIKDQVQWEPFDDLHDLMAYQYPLDTVDGNWDYTCPMSHGLMANPYAIIPCGHTFDGTSLLLYLESSSSSIDLVKCPICRGELVPPYVTPLPLMKAKIWAEAKVQCPCAGCEEVMGLAQLEEHIKTTCLCAW